MFTKTSSIIHHFANRHEKDIFKHTQGRLMRIYSGLLILFLTLFIAVVYGVLHMVIIKNQEQELQTLVSEEANYIENLLLKNEQADLHGSQNQEVVFAGVNQFFYYVIDSHGEIIMGNEVNHWQRQGLLRLVNGMNLHNGKITEKTFHVGRSPNPNGRGNRGEFHPSGAPSDAQLLIASEPIFNKGQYIGQLYIGKDISLTYQLFKWVLSILAIIGSVFIGVAVYMGTVMSKRAMIPISKAFTRQQEFVADASHELRTPLSVLLSSLDAMEMTIDSKEQGVVKRLMTNMRQEVKRMTHLVSDLLTLARSDSNRFELRRERFDYCRQAEKAVESVRTLAAAKEITLSLHSPASLMAAGDSERLSQLLYILLDNAIKYTPNGGNVMLSLAREGQTICMKVQDTGFGIKKEDVAYIFERFYRADKSRSRDMGGHGLGLSIAKRIVETHKGTIQVASEPGKGSIFTVHLPLVLK